MFKAVLWVCNLAAGKALDYVLHCIIASQMHAI